MNRQRHSICQILMIIAVLLFLTACQGGSSGGYFSYRAHSFRAEIQGELGGVKFTAEIGSTSPDGQGECYVHYLSPSSLAGLTVKQDSNGDLTVTLGNLTSSFPAAQSLLLPVQTLFECAEPLTVQKSDGKLLLETAPEHYLTLSPSRLPVAFSSPHLTFTVLWWEVS